ncbi:unnamed protein product, partial [Mesorhabditis spiculigera]
MPKSKRAKTQACEKKRIKTGKVLKKTAVAAPEQKANQMLMKGKLTEKEAEELDKELVAATTPPQLTVESTSLLGSPQKLWSLMVDCDKVLRPSQKCLESHPAIKRNIRSILIDWMMEVCESERQHRETFHLAIDYVDRFLANSSDIECERFQLLGMTAIFIASKYEEIYPPKLEDFIYYTDNACTCHEVREMELYVLEKLNWILSPITSIHWLAFFMQLLGKKELPPPNSGPSPDIPCVVPNLMIGDFMHMAKILDLCLADIRTLEYTYREMAAAVLFNCLEPQKLIQQVTGIHPFSIARIIEWAEPFVRYCDQRRPTGDPIPHRDGVPIDDLHNIQGHNYYDKIEDALAEIEEDRKQLSHQARELRMAGKRHVLRARLYV